jgi:hypothetical protein
MFSRRSSSLQATVSLCMAACVGLSGCGSEDDPGLAASPSSQAFVPMAPTAGPISPSAVVPSSPSHVTPPGTGTTTPPPPPPPPGVSADVDTQDATSLGLTGFTANGRIHPHGAPSEYYFEYGKTVAYGTQTKIDALPPRLAAYFHESWDQSIAGWGGGWSGEDLILQPSGGTSAGYVGFTAPSADDSNHEDGIGYVELPQYLHIGTFTLEGTLTASLGGGDPDFRGARVNVDVRGTNVVPHGTELVFWAQADSILAEQNTATDWRRANWAHTGFNLTDAILASGWQHVDYRLRNNSNAWSYAGMSIAENRPNYIYAPLDDVLGHLNCNFFHILAFVSLSFPPEANIDFDELDIAYRNRSLVLPSNGGLLVSAPVGSDDPARLTDGWRFGPLRTWRSAPNPVAPLEITYEFALPVTVDVIQIHQDPDYPSRDIEVEVTNDGMTWTNVFTGTLPDVSVNGPNFLHVLKRDLNAPAKRARVRILSGYQDERWGLGEIELFGRGAQMKTDDDWYDVNLDINGLDPGATYHYRLVSKSGGVLKLGADRVFTVPAIAKPEVVTGAASRIADGGVKLEGRVNPLGRHTDFFLEYGPTAAYGTAIDPAYAGVEKTPRTVITALTALTPGQTYHYRFAATNDLGTSFGGDQTFVAK